MQHNSIMKTGKSYDSATLVDELLKTDKNVLVLGSAGTGKSYIINEGLRKNCPKNGILLSAPTGTAALRIGGYTINKLFCITIHRQSFPLTVEFEKKIIDANLLIIDEVSMCSYHLLNQIDGICQKVRNNYTKSFGGLKVVMFGDSSQLPPVPCEDYPAELHKEGSDLMFYRANIFEDTDSFNFYRLTHIFRQEDTLFQNLLEKVREGKVSNSDLVLINSKFSPIITYEEDSIYLTTTNAMADMINRKIVFKQEKEVFEVRSVLSKEGDSKIASNLLRKHRIPETVFFSKGSPVMFYRNDKDMHWTNGTMGEVVGIRRKADEVISVDIKLSNGEIIEVLKQNFPIEQRNEDGEYQVIDHAVQFPFKIAYAITIHKSQGMTFDKKMKIVLGNYVSPNLVYVALSRATKLGNIYIEGRRITTASLKMRDSLNEYSVKHRWNMQIVK